jgi:hypothetical protein
MLKVTQYMYKHFGFGETRVLGDYHAQTETGNWCHILSPQNMLELQASLGTPVNYSPHPFLYPRSRIEKSRKSFCLLLIRKDSPIPTDLMPFCRYFLDRRIAVDRVDDSTLNARERVRSFKEASFVIAYHCDTTSSQICLCASRTPFLLLDKPSVLTKDFVALANIRETVKENPSVETLRELYENSDQFEVLVRDTIVEMRKLHVWKDSLYNKPRLPGCNKDYIFALDSPNDSHAALYSNKDGILLCRNLDEILAKNQVLLTPWVGYVTEESKMKLGTKAFSVSLITCLGLIVESESIQTELAAKLDPIPVVALEFPSLSFDYQEWKREGKSVYVLCSDGRSFVSKLTTFSSKLVKKYVPTNNQIVLSDRPLDSKTLTGFVRKGIPFVCPCPGELPDYLTDYPGFIDCSYTPEGIKQILSDELVSNIVAHVACCQYLVFYNKLKKTSIFANCNNVIP